MRSLRKILKNMVIKYKWINILYYFLLLVGNNKTKQEVERRKRLGLFNYKEIAKPLKYYPVDLVIDNNYYGIAKSLQSYTRIHKWINGYIEHGLFIGTYVKDDSISWFTDSIITLSNYRKEKLEKATSKKILPIGPYIHYCNDILNEKEFEKIKGEVGRVLLVIPSHSIKNIEALYDENYFIEKIEQKKEKFNTVIVCLYWRDALNEKLVDRYKSKGYLITTAGNIYDYYFLSRLKSIINLANMTMSNFIGTHIGYCIYLKKPFWSVNQKVNYVSSIEGELNREFERGDEAKYSAINDEAEIHSNFSVYQEEITEKQLSIVEKYWGLSSIVSVNKLTEILKNRLS